jgi:hypothetical protein
MPATRLPLQNKLQQRAPAWPGRPAGAGLGASPQLSCSPAPPRPPPTPQAASFGLIQEGSAHSGLLVVGGVLLGALFISASKTWLDQHEDVSFQDLQGADARKVLLIIGVMAAHAVGARRGGWRRRCAAVMAGCCPGSGAGRAPARRLTPGAPASHAAASS